MMIGMRRPAITHNYHAPGTGTGARCDFARPGRLGSAGGDREHHLPSSEITFDCRGTTLAGTFTTPPGPGPHPTALLIAGSGPLDRDGNVKRQRLDVSRDLAVMLDEIGWATLRFDKRGVGASEGDYLSTGFFDELADVESAMRWLDGRPDVDVIVPIGHSIGATMAAELAAGHDVVSAAVLLAVTAQTGEETLTWQAAQIAPTMPGIAKAVLRLMRTDLLRQQRKAIDRLKATTGDVTRIQGAKVNAKWMREFIAYDPLPTLRRIQVPVLAMTGSKDVQVNPADLATIAEAVPTAETHVLESVDHILRHEPRPISNVRRYRKQLENPIDPSVATLLVEWLGRAAIGGA